MVQRVSFVKALSLMVLSSTAYKWGAHMRINDDAEMAENLLEAATVMGQGLQMEVLDGAHPLSLNRPDSAAEARISELASEGERLSIQLKNNGKNFCVITLPGDLVRRFVEHVPASVVEEGHVLDAKLMAKLCGESLKEMLQRITLQPSAGMERYIDQLMAAEPLLKGVVTTGAEHGERVLSASESCKGNSLA